MPTSSSPEVQKTKSREEPRRVLFQRRLRAPSLSAGLGVLSASETNSVQSQCVPQLLSSGSGFRKSSVALRQVALHSGASAYASGPKASVLSMLSTALQSLRRAARANRRLRIAERLAVSFYPKAVASTAMFPGALSHAGRASLVASRQVASRLH